MGEDRKKLLVLAATGLLFVCGFAIILNVNTVARHKSDIFQRWYATVKLLSEHRSLYDVRNGQEVIRLFGSLFPESFYYPAHLLVFTAPLALVPYPVAHLLWTIAVQVFFLVAVWLSTRLVSWPTSVNQLSVLLVAAALFIPNMQHTIWGQFNTIGVLSLVLCLYALRQERYALAGVWATGLTFKPHTMVLPLVFLLVWALLCRVRWRFLLGFAVSSLVLWATAELFQSGWVSDFFAVVGKYASTNSVLDLLWNPHQVTAAGLCCASLVLFLLNGRAPAMSSAFIGCLSLSVAVWFLAVPVLGMLHIVVLPVIAVLLLSSLRSARPTLYPYALYGIILLYILGLIGFLWGLSSAELYGKHIFWSELAYKVAAPIWVGLFSLLLCTGAKRGMAGTT